MKIRHLLMILICAQMLFACGKDRYEYKTGPGEKLGSDEGLVEFMLSNVYPNQTKSDALNVNDFTVEVFNSKGSKIKKWAKYSDIAGQKVKFNVGTFTLKAFLGDSTATGFDAVYFAGKSSFVVEGQKSKAVSVTCKQSNVALSVLWGPNLVADYSDYKVVAYRKGYKDSLVFAKDELRKGYIPAGTIKFKVYLTKKDGSKRTVSSSTMDVVGLANDDITLTFNTKAETLYDLDVSFKISNEVTERVLNLVIPGILVGKAKPSISSENVTDGAVTYIDGIATPVKIDINAPGYIESCLLKVNSKSLANLGWPSEIELVDLKNKDIGVYNVLKNSGLNWIENMDSQKLAYVNFTDVIPNIKYTEADVNVNTISLIVKDVQQQTSDEYSFTLTPTKANLLISQPNAYDVWGSWANIAISTDNGNVDNLVLEYSKAANSWQEATVDVISAQGSGKVLKVKNLTPGTAYSFRVKYNNVYSQEISVTTESALQLANSNFEDWQQGTYGRQNQPIFYPWNSGDSNPVWDTNNKDVMPSGYLTLGYYNYKCFPAVSYSTTSRSGSKSAQLMAIAVSNGNTSGTSLSGATAGILYIGSKDKGTTGTSISSRPSKLSFYYQYTPLGGSPNDTFEAYVEIKNGDTVIGSGTFTKTVEKSSPVSSWAEALVDINYTNTQLKATSIYVRFISSTMSSPTYQVGVDVYLAGTKYNCHGGSVLLLDDLSLIY